MSKKVEVSSESIGITILNNCYACLQLDVKCPECQEDFDNSQTVLAHKIVDEGSITEPLRVNTWLYDLPSGHDWTGSATRRADGSIRYEFVDPVVSMEDRTYSPALELESMETVCTSCHLVCWSQLPCPNCEEVNL